MLAAIRHLFNPQSVKPIDRKQCHIQKLPEDLFDVIQTYLTVPESCRFGSTSTSNRRYISDYFKHKLNHNNLIPRIPPPRPSWPLTASYPEQWVVLNATVAQFMPFYPHSSPNILSDIIINHPRCIDTIVHTIRCITIPFVPQDYILQSIAHVILSENDLDDLFYPILVSQLLKHCPPSPEKAQANAILNNTDDYVYPTLFLLLSFMMRDH